MFPDVSKFRLEVIVSGPFRVVGIDVSKAQLDIAIRPEDQRWICKNVEGRFQELARRFVELDVELVVLEATGGLEMPVAEALVGEGLQVAIVNPRQVRDFAKATGRLAKTDRIDADIIAHFGQAVRPKPRPLPDRYLRELRALVTRRRQLLDLKVAESNRRKSSRSDVIRASIDCVLGTLNQQVSAIQADIEQLVCSRSAWKKRSKLLMSVPGVGITTAAVLLAELPELGNTNRSEVAALVGVAPLNCDSGTIQGKRAIWGGRATTRSALYMATLCASQHNPVISAFYTRLLSHGKAKKVALTACMRKLLVILNAIVRSNQAISEHRTVEYTLKRTLCNGSAVGRNGRS